MQNLRNAKFITRLVLVWFALFIGVSVASPLVKPQASQMVCSAMGGMKMVAVGEEGTDTQASTSMDCPLCAAVVIPLHTDSLAFETPSALAHALRPLAAAHIASVTAPPLPSRGPPSIS